jgi:hypothetical protein
MKILYIAKHGQPNNDDENSIWLSLLKLEHDVDRFQLSNLNRDKQILDQIRTEYDFVLFHKLPSQDYVEYVCSRWKGICWYFDAIGKGFASNDDYIDMVKNICFMGFFTDGDFVNSQGEDKIKLLRQGLDIDLEHDNSVYKSERKVLDFMFIGTVGHGGYTDREKYLSQLSHDYKWKPHTQYSIFKDKLAAVCQGSKIMLAMPPVTDHYWSNRVYLLGGRSGFVLHPYASDLENQFGESLAFYKDYEELKSKIDFYCENDEKRERMAREAHSIIVNGHTYLHRCKELTETLNDYR